jgi:hypothetical protein
MVSRRDVLVLGGATLLSACGGGGGRPGDTGGAAPGPGTTAPRGPYGVLVADWAGALQASGDVQAGPADQPSGAFGATTLRLGYDAPPSSARQGVVAGAQAYAPPQAAPGFSAALWVRNRGPRTLAFQLRLFNAGGAHQLRWNCAADPEGRWILLTMSPSQLAMSSWAFGTDTVGAVRIEQQDDAPEGPWQPGDALEFGEVYIDVPGTPLFLITFDDGFDSQRNPAPPPPAVAGQCVTATHDGTFVTAAANTVVVGDTIVFPLAAPSGLQAGVRYWVQSLPAPNAFTLAADATLATPVPSDGYAGNAPFSLANGPARSGQQIVESHGFKGSLFLVPGWLGTTGVHGYSRRPNRFMTAADAQAMHADGWSVGSHTMTHPSSADNAGLRLLGPYGYFLSNPVDALPAQYVRAWGLNAAWRRRLVAAAAGSNVLTFEHPHQFLINMPIVFTGAVPPGLEPGVPYYCQTIPSPVSATFATDQGSLNATADVRADWTGLADYRYPGAALDDSAIFDDIVAGIAGLAALGIPTGANYFALPHGAADVYVRSACLRAGLGWIRGASDRAHTIAAGYPTGGGLSNIANTPGGWLAQPDCIQTDNLDAPSITTILDYVDAGIAQKACGCSYHHMVGGATVANLDNLCAALRTRADQGLVQVVTLDQMAAMVRRP